MCESNVDEVLNKNMFEIDIKIRDSKLKMNQMAIEMMKIFISMMPKDKSFPRKTKDMADKNMGHMIRLYGFLNWKEMCLLAKCVHNGSDCIISILRSW